MWRDGLGEVIADMHGIIMTTLQSFVVETYGEDAWVEVQKRADVERKTYVPVTVYPDEDLYELADAAGAVTGTDAQSVLEAYGAFVIPSLLEVYEVHIDDDWSGLELIDNIQQFHTSLRTRELSDLSTPRVRTERLGENRVAVQYDSDRQLCAVARGAIRGVAEQFGESLDCAERSCMHDGDDACRFVVTRTAAPTVGGD